MHEQFFFERREHESPSNLCAFSPRHFPGRDCKKPGSVQDDRHEYRHKTFGNWLSRGAGRKSKTVKRPPRERSLSIVEFPKVDRHPCFKKQRYHRFFGFFFPYPQQKDLPGQRRSPSRSPRRNRSHRPRKTSTSRLLGSLYLLRAILLIKAKKKAFFRKRIFFVY